MRRVALASAVRCARLSTAAGNGKKDGTIRINAWLSRNGVCSRREADNLLRKGFVKLDGEVVPVGMCVPDDANLDIKVDPEGLSAQEAKMTFLLNKPRGYVSGLPSQEEVPAVRLLEDLSRCMDPPEVIRKLESLTSARYLKGVAPCGRLDKDSTGLLVFTQDGRVASKLLSRQLKKEYLVRVKSDKPITDDILDFLQSGSMSLDGQTLWPITVNRTEAPSVLQFTLQQGKKRQIRRMCDHVGLQVTGLARTRVGNIRLDLPKGGWRILRPDESFD
mmetsp:Transcript_14970/g.29132  ORF Transcript_14970/g.29132 Transcript_14970/m.29132 type:complete len:276 (+) Transcript_14970:76-903(+)